MPPVLTEYGLPLLDDNATLLGVVTGLPDPTTILGPSYFQEQAVDTDPAEWDAVDANRALTTNVGPDDKAQVKAKSNVSKYSAHLAYFREQILRGAREIQAAQLAQTQAGRDRLTARFGRDVQNVRNGITLTREAYRWGALRGSYAVSMANGQSVTVDTKIPDENTIAAGGSVDFSDSTLDIVTALDSYVAGLQQYGGSGIELVTGQAGINWILANKYIADIIKRIPALAAQVLSKGIPMDPIRDITLRRYTETYTAADGTATPFIKANTSDGYEAFLIATNEKVGLDLEGPPPDLGVDQGARGWYAKNIDDQDPSGRRQIIGYVGAPVVRYIRRVIHIADLRSASVFS